MPRSVRNIAAVTTAVANGDLSTSITVDAVTGAGSTVPVEITSSPLFVDNEFLMAATFGKRLKIILNWPRFRSQ